MAEVTNEFLARMIDSRFKATAAEFAAVNHRLDMVTTSIQEIASLSASGHKSRNYSPPMA